MKNIFDSSVYQARRAKLKEAISTGVAVFLGNQELPMNYTSNTFPFRQDSTFLYFFGHSIPHIAAIIDFEEGKEILFGDNFDIDDIIWMGSQPTIAQLAQEVGISESRPFNALNSYLKGRTIHYLYPYQAENQILLSDILELPLSQLRSLASPVLTKAIVQLRSVKEAQEIEQIENACEIGVKMHLAVMQSCKSGISEKYLAGLAEGISLSYGNGVSFPIILSQHGETLHNHKHDTILKSGNLLLMDAGAENLYHYASDYTRTIPVNGIFETRHRELYEIVLRANTEAIAASKPGILYRDVHLLAAEIIAEGLKALGLMKGNCKEAVAHGAHALFFPHGLGHQLGLDVHDMENLGENFVGYDETIQRSTQFGLSALRMARELKPGFVITVEPGIYFIPELIDIWRQEKKLEEFINYEKVEQYRDAGGIRIEDDILITENGCRLLGPSLPKTVSDITEIVNG